MIGISRTYKNIIVRHRLRRRSQIQTRKMSSKTDTTAPTAPTHNLASPLPKICLNSDKTKNQLIRTSEQEWLSTAARGTGVQRRLIERLGDEEKARATTIVKFEPGQTFPKHTHPGGEEFLVLAGVWRDHYGIFPKYSYIRNYIGSGHTPSIGDEGVVILVKLCQMTLDHKEEDHTSWIGSPNISGSEEMCWEGGRIPLNLRKSAWKDVETEKSSDGHAETEKSSDRYMFSAETGMQLHCKRSPDSEPDSAPDPPTVRQMDFFHSSFEHIFALNFPGESAIFTRGGFEFNLIAPPNGMEFLIVDGEIQSSSTWSESGVQLTGSDRGQPEIGRNLASPGSPCIHDEYSWTRLVEGASLAFRITKPNTYLWIKEGHLNMPEIPLSMCI